MMWDCGYHQYTVSLVNTDEFLPRTIRLRLEVSKYFIDILNIFRSDRISSFYIVSKLVSN